MFRPQATAEYVNANTRGALLAVAPVSARWLLAAASGVLVAAFAVAAWGTVRDRAEGRGEVRSSARPVALLAPADVKVRAVRRGPGDAVKRGEVIVDLDASAAQEALRECERRLERLRKNGAAAQAELAAKLERKEGGDAVAYLLEQRVDRSAELLEDETAKCQRVGAVARLESLVSPVDGTIGSVETQAGAPVKEGASLASIVPADASTRGYMHVSESQVGRIEPGAPVYLRFDAYPYENYGTVEGKVVRVLDDDASEADERRLGGHEAQEDDFHKVVEVEIQRVPSAIRVRNGLRFSAAIITGERSIASLLMPH